MTDEDGHGWSCKGVQKEKKRKGIFHVFKKANFNENDTIPAQMIQSTPLVSTGPWRRQ